MSDKKFHLSDKFLDTLVRPQLDIIVNRQIEDCRYSLVSFFRSYIFDLYHQNKDGKYKLCDAKSINPQLEEYLMVQFLPLTGISPGEHTISQMEKLVDTLTKELIKYYSDNTDEFDDEGRVVCEDGCVYVIIDEYKEREIPKNWVTAKIV